MCASKPKPRKRPPSKRVPSPATVLYRLVDDTRVYLEEGKPPRGDVTVSLFIGRRGGRSHAGDMRMTALEWVDLRRHLRRSRWADVEERGDVTW